MLRQRLLVLLKNVLNWASNFGKGIADAEEKMIEQMYGKKKMKVTKARSFTKSLTYRVFGTLFSWAIVYVIIGKGSLATLIAFWETVVKISIYYWHERIWDKINWGKLHRQFEE